MIIDPHVHVMNTKSMDLATFKKLGLPEPKDTPIEKLVEWLRGAGVEKAVIFGQDMTRIWNSSCGEDYVLKCVKRYPDFFMALASVEPIDIYDRFNRVALSYFERAIGEYGFKGVLLTPPYGHYCSDNPAVYPFYEKAMESGVVVQFHHSMQPGPTVLAPHKYADPVSLDNVLVDFPDLKVVVEHLLYPRCEELFHLMMCDPNLYADIAFTYNWPHMLTWNLVKAKDYGVIDRVMYGSDYWVAGQWLLSKNPAEDMKKWINFIKTGLNEKAEKCGWSTFTQEEIDGILYKNAAKLYDLQIG
ncbi:MAG TPA: amidohydrolase [candidate division CPR3 bacterium]|uniref:Amidohydrolase n=1 Tax=candidate division CPR3 bacterium TaxID=2268181 RepID=A0A7C1NS58_UNCC3|nr:amidohydrolase [candidate division CPR3 bacterium]